MPTSASSVSFETTAPPRAVFAVLTDLRGFSSWLPRSSVYGGTAGVADSEVGVGDTYVDHTPTGDMHGQIVELVPDRRVVFVQSTAGENLSIRISYDLSEIEDGTRVDRRGEITTGGMLRVVHPLVVAAVRKENRRTMRELRGRVEQ